jgi:hypothetical protein
MKFCPVVPEICRGQVHGPRKERRKRRRRRIIIIIKIKIIIRNGAKTISLPNRLNENNNKKRSKINKSPKLCLGDLITIISCDYLNLSLVNEYVGDVTIPTQVIKYNNNFLQVDQPIRLQYSNQIKLLVYKPLSFSQSGALEYNNQWIIIV